jgi:hypothetical protein
LLATASHRKFLIAFLLHFGPPALPKTHPRPLNSKLTTPLFFLKKRELNKHGYSPYQYTAIMQLHLEFYIDMEEYIAMLTSEISKPVRHETKSNERAKPSRQLKRSKRKRSNGKFATPTPSPS